MTSRIPSASIPSWPARLAAFAADIKISHTIFALPWAVLATFHAAGGWPGAGRVGLIVACMVTARTFAMGMNRLLDARLDAMNPRTSGRAIPSGRLPRSTAILLTLISAALFILATAGFGVGYDNWIPLMASWGALVFVGAYPLLKRFTQWCHYYLGAALALAPTCAWLAIAGRIDAVPLIMSGAVLLWTAGFDILYACQDFQSDRQTGVHSVPSRLGLPAALRIARATHLACAALLVMLGWISSPLSSIYFTGVVIACLLLVIEHAIVQPDDLSRINLAFFTLNGVVSLVLGMTGIIDIVRYDA